MKQPKKRRVGVVSDEDVEQIHHRTGIPKVVVRKSLLVFYRALNKYLRGPMELPLYIKKVFTIYKRKNKKTDEMIKNWRDKDRNLPYKK